MTRGPVPATLADAVYEVVHGGPLPPKQLAARVGKTHGYLLDASNPHDELKFQAQLIVPLTLAQGNPAIVRYLAHECGGLFIERPRADAGDLDVVRAHAEVLREVGEDAQAIGSALSRDGRIDADEATAILRDIDEMLTRLAALRAVVAQRSGDGALTIVARPEGGAL
ncbi:MAG: hypothetical protein Q8L86_10220 [Vicinamibacterales bacterium]|nr:hypothetical protein [Vicinamibacterales bacterium]